jgi:hypothetical protein
MGKRIMLKVSAVTTILGGRRHQGRHRRGPTPRDETRFGRVKVRPGQPQTATADHTNQDTAPADFYVVFPNVPALPSNLGS